MYKGISIQEDIIFPFRTCEMREKQLVFLVCILFLAILILFHLLLPEMQEGSISMVRMSIGRTGNRLLFPKVRGGSSGALRHGEEPGGDLHQVRLQWCHFGGFRLKLLRSLHWDPYLRCVLYLAFIIYEPYWRTSLWLLLLIISYPIYTFLWFKIIFFFLISLCHMKIKKMVQFPFRSENCFMRIQFSKNAAFHFSHFSAFYRAK